ncbi:hypothetical protein JR316_0009633 [Psilocybe cubensis]|uniref:Uncharacterized protein n=2 Tax=Psilocybe cubensis TaxID=181762 RepID=A0ACB8GPL5_PSICU|nr:hypothetical protein JR316_0009633 [Psilocybe cubensis]KAH9477420.1 hypothetical protein JR316_0009633 [Psilocybe cubensis]
MSGSAGPSPTSLSRSATTLGPSTSSFPQPKPQRHVVSTTKKTTSSMPRPLHLALGSVVGSSSSATTPGSISPSPSPSSHSATQNGHSSGGGDNTLFVEPGTFAPSGTSRAPSPLPLSPNTANVKRSSTSSSTKLSKASKRSSISYLPPDGPSQTQRERASVDGLLRTPLSSTTSFFGDAGRDVGAGLTRSSSLGRGLRTPRSPAFPERGTQGTKEASLAPPSHLKDRPPVTLAEKHAELLHFIAQKESKCLELRSQLAVHEAELLQLKRKWERIVNRGFERSQSLASTPSSSNLPTSTSSLLSSSASPNTLSHNTSGGSSTASPSYFNGLAPAANVPGAVVLEGIKGGVQGMSRLIAAGLESIVHVNGPATPTTPLSARSDALSSGHAASTPLRAPVDGAPASKHWAKVDANITRTHGHGQKESQSSSSTTTSAASSATFASTSTRISTTSTAASVSGSSTSGDTTRKPDATGTTTSSAAASVISDVDSEFGDFEDGKQRSLSPEQEQDVLMVYDTGATPTMSPNPHFRRKRPAEHIHVEKLVLPPTDAQFLASGAGSADKDKEMEDFDWDDGWDEPASEAQARDSASVSSSLRDTAPEASPRTESAASVVTSPAPAVGALNTATPTTQQMSYWVGSVGKKWDELKGSNTFTKSQKRASLLLSDMQNTIVSALTSPPTSTKPLFGDGSYTKSPQMQSPNPGSPATFSSNASQSTLLSPRIPTSAQPRPRSATSLLDDSDEELGSDVGANQLRAKLNSRMMAPVMVPDSLSPTAASQSKQVSKVKVTTKKSAVTPAPPKDDEDEWNW